VERYDLLTGDPLRSRDGGSGARALRRLDVAAARIGRLDSAERGLATLTRARLAALIAPTRGDEALAAALARCSSTSTAEVELEPPARRRLTTPPARTGIGRSQPIPLARRQRESVLFDRPHAATVRASAPARTATANAARMRTGTQATLLFEHRPLDIAAEAVDGVRGLEWFATRVPGGAAASATPLVAPVPAVERSRSVAKMAAEAATASAMPWSVPGLSAEPRSLPGPVEVEQAADPSVSPLRPASAAPPPPVRVGARGLEALVNAWADVEQGSPTPTERPAPAAAAATGENFSPAPVHASSPSRSSRAPQPEEEPLAFGDAIGRALVAELRRYGIEVDA